MLQGSNSDLFGHRKSFLSAGVSFWGETQSAADNWEEARRPDCVASCSLHGTHSRGGWWEYEFPVISCRQTLLKRKKKTL